MLKGRGRGGCDVGNSVDQFQALVSPTCSAETHNFATCRREEMKRFLMVFGAISMMGFLDPLVARVVHQLKMDGMIVEVKS